jgi:hypothetical protein
MPLICDRTSGRSLSFGAENGQKLGRDRRREVQLLLVLVVGDRQVEGSENLDKLLLARGV